MFVSGVTRVNAQDKINQAQTALNQAVNNGASDKEVMALAQAVVDIKATLKSIETREANAYNKMTERDKLVTDARNRHADEIYQKEKDDRAEAERKQQEEQRKAEERERKRLEEQERLQQERWNSIHDSVVNFGNTISGAVNSIADASFHALLGPLNLLVNPLEKALNFNLFNIGKKTAAEILTLPIKPLRNDIEKKGGLIGATGIFIADTITKSLSKHGFGDASSDEDGSSSKTFWEKVKDGITTGGGLAVGNAIGSALGAAAEFVAPVVGALAIVGAGVAVAWANEWDKKGPEIVNEYIATMNDPEASDWDRMKAELKFTADKIFKGFFGGVAGAIRNYSENKDEMDRWLYGEEGPETFFQNALSAILAFGKGEADVWSQYDATLAKYLKAINDPTSDLYYKMQALKILDPDSPLFDDKIDTQDSAYLRRVMGGLTEQGRKLWATSEELSSYLEKGYSASLIPGSYFAYSLYDKDGNPYMTPLQEAAKKLDDYLLSVQVQRAEIYAETLVNNAAESPFTEERVAEAAAAFVEAAKNGKRVRRDDIEEILYGESKKSEPTDGYKSHLFNPGLPAKNEDSIISQETVDAFNALMSAAGTTDGTGTAGLPLASGGSIDAERAMKLLEAIANNTENSKTTITNISSPGALDFEDLRL